MHAVPSVLVHKTCRGPTKNGLESVEKREKMGKWVNQPARLSTSFRFRLSRSNTSLSNLVFVAEREQARRVDFVTAWRSRGRSYHLEPRS